MKRSNHIVTRVPIIGCILVLLQLGLAASSTAQTMQLELAPATSSRINVPDGVKRIFISNPAIVDAQPIDDGYAVLVTGQRQGKAELRIGRLTQGELVYLIEVAPELQDLATEVGRILGEIDGLEINVVGDKIMLSGKLLSKDDVAQVEETAAAFAGRVLSMVELDKNVNELIKIALEREIGLSTVDLIIEGDKLTAMGTVPSQSELERVKGILKRRHDNVVLLLMVSR